MNYLIEHIFGGSKDDSIECPTCYTEVFVTIEQLPNGMSIPVAIFRDRRTAQRYEDFQQKVNKHRQLFTFAVDVDNRVLEGE